VKDVKPINKVGENWYYLTLNGKTGPRQVMIFKYQQLLRNYLNSYTADPNAPLFATIRMYSKDSFSEDEDKRKQAKYSPRTHLPLSPKIINKILKTAADRAEIRKNIHAHILRHSQATRLANTMTEQQLKVFMGWQPGSNMSQVYVHLSGKDMDKATLKSYGVAIKEADGDIVERCDQCGSVVSPGIQYCGTCGLPLSEEAKQNRKESTEITNLILSSPSMKELREKFRLYIKEKREKESKS